MVRIFGKDIKNMDLILGFGPAVVIIGQHIFWLRSGAGLNYEDTIAHAWLNLAAGVGWAWLLLKHSGIRS